MDSKEQLSANDFDNNDEAINLIKKPKKPKGHQNCLKFENKKAAGEAEKVIYNEFRVGVNKA